MKVIILLAVAVAAAQAGPLDSIAWDSLRVTWNAVPFLGWDKMPRQVSELKSDFVLKDDLCATGKGQLLGQRYWYKQDPALMLLFDKNGFIAGIQTAIEKSQFTPSDHLKGKSYIDDGDYWTLSAYFIDPSLICGAGRTQEEFDKTGTGTGLYIQMGPDPVKNSFNVPMSEDDMKSTKWGNGKCFWTMGQHYWYNTSKDMSCDDMVPNCLIYNNARLTAFCFATNGMFPSTRYDFPHPSNKVVAQFMDPEPDCFFSVPSYKIESTLHVFFKDNARLTALC